MIWTEPRLRDVIAALVSEYTEFLVGLVHQESVFSHEHAAQMLVKARMDALGWKVSVVHSRPDDESVNLAVRIPGAGGGRSLVLNAHCDVTPVEGIWKHPPFGAVIEDGLLYGRGAQDDKAGIAVILLVAESLQWAGVRLKGDLVLHSVIEDETTGNGSLALVRAGFSGDGIIICDGTWPERIIHAHLGQIWLDVHVRGSPVAACVEHRGVNPIYLGLNWVERLRRWAEEQNTTATPFENIDRPFFVNVGSFQAGVWHGSVPAKAQLEVQVGFGPDMTPDGALGVARCLAAEVSDRIRVEQGLLATPAWRVAPDSALIRFLKPIVERNSGKECKVMAVTGHCDMRHFGTENVCLYGPGAGWGAHGVDECYRLEDMARVANNIAEFAMNWCGVAVSGAE